MRNFYGGEYILADYSVTGYSYSEFIKEISDKAHQRAANNLRKIIPSRGQDLMIDISGKKYNDAVTTYPKGRFVLKKDGLVLQDGVIDVNITRSHIVFASVSSHSTGIYSIQYRDESEKGQAFTLEYFNLLVPGDYPIGVIGKVGQQVSLECDDKGARDIFQSDEFDYLWSRNDDRVPSFDG